MTYLPSRHNKRTTAQALGIAERLTAHARRRVQSSAALMFANTIFYFHFHVFLPMVPTVAYWVFCGIGHTGGTIQVQLN